MRARFWLRWGGRDLRSRWTVVVATALVLAIGTGLFATLGGMKAWRTASADASFAALRAHDLRIALADGSFARGGRLGAVAAGVDGVAEVQERLTVPTQLDASRPGAPVLVAGRIVGMDVGVPQPIDALAPHRGRVLGPADAGRPVAALERSFATYHELPATGTLRAGRTRLRYVGHAMAPEWFIVSREGTVWGAEASFGVVFTSLETAQAVAGRPRAVNEAVIRLAPGTDPAAAVAAVRRAFAQRLPRLGAEVTPLAEENAHLFLYRDADNDQRIFLVFAVLILVGAGLAAFNLVSRVVEAQRREIGIGMALGVDPPRLAIRPLLLGLQVAVLGTVFGIGVALATAELFKPILNDMLPLPIIETPFQTDFFAMAAALGLVIPLLAAAVPVWRGVRVAPIEAIRVGFRAARGAGLAGILRRVPVPGRSVGQMPLRNVLRAPRRTLMTVAGVAAVIAVVVSLGGMIDSFNSTVGQARDEVERMSPDRSVVTLDTPRPVASAAIRAIGAAPAVGAAEPGLRVPGGVRGPAGSVDVSLELVSARSRLWRPSVEEGAPAAGGRGILLSRRAADDLGVAIGDTVALRHPVRTGPAALGTATSRVRVAGIHGNPFRQVAILDAGWARSMGLAGMANTVAVVPARGASARDVQRDLFGMPAVASVEEAGAVARTLDDAMGQFAAALRIGWLFALALAALMAFNATTINADERRREHATMFAFGLLPRSVLRIDVVESATVGVLSTVAGLAGGLAILTWIVRSLVPDTFPDLGVEVAVAPVTVVAAGVAGILALALAPLLSARRLRRMDVPATLRVME